MKQSILAIFSLLMAPNFVNAQLFSSGNNVIAGNNVGIGTNTPVAKLHIGQNLTGFQELLRMQNLSPTGGGRFTIYSDGLNNYSTFTKYGSGFAGNYAGLTGLYPFANLLAFGNNGVAANDGLGRFLISTAGNAGISIFKGGTSKLKFHADFTTENVGIGGNTAPVSRVHLNNTDGTTMDLRLTNTTTGHSSNDGLFIRNTGLAATIMNQENSSLELGTNNLTQFKINSDGKIVMGTTATPAGYKLFVEEGILTEKVKVAVKTSSEWSDYVFAQDYNLKQLPEVEAYILEHKHLPGVPSAQDVVDNGLDIAKMDAKLLEKIEELTLHLIEMDKKMKELQSRLEVSEKK